MSGKRRSFVSTDGFAAVLFAVLFAALAYLVASDFFYGFETDAYDRAMRWSAAQPSDQVAVIGIDEESIRNIGRWPWERAIQGAMIDQLKAGGAKVIASTVFMSEPQLDPGLHYIDEALEFIRNSRLSTQTSSTLPRPVLEDLTTLWTGLEEASASLDNDRQLATSIANAGNVALPVIFRLGAPRGRPDSSLPDYIRRHAVSIDSDASIAIPAESVTLPIPEFGEPAAVLGHLNADLDADGSQRFEPLMIDYFDAAFPSLALAVAAKSLNLSADDIEIIPGEAVRVGGLEVKTTPALRMYNRFYPDKNGVPAISADSFYDVFSGRIPAENYRGKIVLIGANAPGIGDSFPTPVSPNMSPVITLAHTISSILSEDFIIRPDWAGYTELGIFLLLAAYLVFLLPKLNAGLASVVSLALLAALLVAEYALLINQSTWLKLVIPALFLATGHMFMTIRRFRVTERLKLSSDADSAESNKMLGLAYQGQGQLDHAFDKFQKCPLDDSLMRVLYNLALDFERKRQFNKAAAVYTHMRDYDASFKDITDRIERNQQMDETLLIGGGSKASLVLDTSGVQRPMLGRYEVEKEIGKGAMGTVYLGRDPKINRVVAIKTLALAEEFEEDELKAVKDRFFREAETAGRLSHPEIVTIFDAGEEHDLAYIAMEFLKGTNLNDYIKPTDLLPPGTALALASRAADALDYAHRQNIVHRDIKPSNLMWEAESDEFKITDFGIARITDSSKTKTGLVLGTPSYMSPEQLSGKPIDGRSDLFSLGVTLYQLLTGRLPFQADSMATLMYKIANDDPTPVATVRPELPDCVGSILSRVLDKEPDRRFQRGAEFAQAVRRCASQNFDESFEDVA